MRGVAGGAFELTAGRRIASALGSKQAALFAPGSSKIEAKETTKLANWK